MTVSLFCVLYFFSGRRVVTNDHADLNLLLDRLLPYKLYTESGNLSEVNAMNALIGCHFCTA